MSFRLTVLLTVVLALGPAAAARAAWFPAQAVDGPGPDVQALGNVDVARDGTGAVAYLRLDGGAPHVFVSRLFNGVWQPPVRIDYSTGPASEVKLAVGDGNRLAVAWIADGNVYGASAPVSPAPVPLSAATPLGGPGAQSVDVDLGVNDAAYAVWQQGGDVLAARLQDATWTDLPAPLDINPADVSGTGALRPEVAVSAEGFAVATWGETTDRTRVYARRLLGLALSAFPQQVSQDADGGNADSPDLAIQDDGSFAWVTYRQDAGGSTHTFARRLRGSTFDPPVAIDAGTATVEPRVDINGDGQGEAVAQSGDNGLMGATLDHNVFAPAVALSAIGSAQPSAPEVAAGDRGDVAVAWRGPGDARAREKPFRQPFGPETAISNPALGAVADPGVSISGDRVGDFAVAMVQGPAGARALTIAVYDDPPTAPFIGRAASAKPQSRPQLSWTAGLDLWGQQLFRVLIDGKPIGETHATTFVPAAPIRAGKHTWQVEAVDLHGQIARSRTRTLRIDSLAPRLTVKVSGRRGAGLALKISVRARDVGGSGLDHVNVDYGDRTRIAHATTTIHVYRRGSFTLKVSAVDKAGNVARKQVKLRIK